MTDTKHAKTRPEDRPRDDLKDNPAIGQSKGTTIAGEDPDLIEGENTVEGDVENDPDRIGQANADKLGRTNP